MAECTQSRKHRFSQTWIRTLGLSTGFATPIFPAMPWSAKTSSRTSCINSGSQFKGESKFSTWIYKVALNTAITHIRRSTRTPRYEELTESVACAPDLNDHMRQEEEIHQLHEAIAALTDIDKAIILLHLEDHNYDEIAYITGLTRTNVSVRLVRIKRALKDYLQRNQVIQGEEL